jgi:hypothetical protein
MAGPFRLLAYYEAELISGKHVSYKICVLGISQTATFDGGNSIRSMIIKRACSERGIMASPIIEAIWPGRMIMQRFGPTAGHTVVTIAQPAVRTYTC